MAFNWLYRLFRRQKLDRNMDQELAFHISAHAEQLRERGVPAEEAERRARIEFGGPESYRKQCREAGKAYLLRDLASDLKYSLRVLRKSRGFTVIAILALALGIGATSAVFTVIHAVLLKPLPFPNSERVVVMWERTPKMDMSVAYPDFEDWRARSRSFDSMAASRRDSLNLTGAGEPERLPVRYVSWEFFHVFGVKIPQGRDFTSSDDRAGAPPVVVLMDSLWKRRYGSDPQIVGKSITLNNQLFTVIGIAPPEFKYGAGVELFAPISLARNASWNTRREHPGIYVFGRLKPEVTLQRARSEMENIGKAINLQNDGQGEGAILPQVQPVRENLIEGVERPMWITFAAVLFMLLITCSNVASLALARATTRYREFAVRSAVGAGKGRLLRQMLTENIVLSLIGGAAGLALAYWGLALLRSANLTSLPRLDEVTIDGSVLLFMAGASIFTGILFGLYPARVASRADMNVVLNDTAGRGVVGGQQRFHHLLITAQFAFACVMLIGAGLTLKSLLRVLKVDPGFNPHQLLVFQLSIPKDRAGVEALQVVESLREKMAAIPGVQQAAFSSGMPMGFAVETIFYRGDEPIVPNGGRITTQFLVTPQFFSAMGIELLKGRSVSEEDRLNSRPVVVIDENLAKDVFGDSDPIGRTLKYADPRRDTMVIVGVVRHVKHYGIDSPGPVQDEMYVPIMQVPPQLLPVVLARLSFQLRASVAPESLAPAIRAAALQVMPEQPIFGIRSYEWLIGIQTETRRVTAGLLTAFAVLALLLAAIGIYGVIAYSISQRTHEIGVRMALGARISDIAGLVMRQALLVIAFGLVLGLGASLLLARYLTAILFEVKGTDAQVLTGIAILMSSVALLAALPPTLRATRVDPMIALRHD